MATTNDQYLDAMITHKVNLERLSNGSASRVIDEIKRRIEASIVIPDNLLSMTTRQSNRIASQIESILKEIIITSYENFEQEMINVAQYEKKYNENTLVRIMPSAVVVNVAEDLDYSDIIKKLQVTENKTAKDVFERLANKTSSNYKKKIIDGYREGINPNDIAKQIFQAEKTTIFGATDLKKLENNIKAISRTAMNSINANVSKDILDRNKELLKGYLWTATLDSRTSLICAGRDGRVYPIDTKVRPPAHYNCRSILTPVFKSSKDLGIETRASMDGQVPNDITYGDFLKKKSDSFIKDVLGEKRGQLFIDGKVDIDGFTDASGRTYTLEELAKRENVKI